jgi:hypothetical protein
MAPFLPIETGVVDLALSAMVSHLTQALIDDIDPEDVSRAVVVKAGPRQSDPESVTVMLHENDLDNPAQWPHQPLKFHNMRASGQVQQDPYSTSSAQRLTTGYSLVGGGSMYSRAFTAEIEVFGSFISGVNIGREESRQIASIVENRLVKALLEAGPKIGSGHIIRDDFGESILEGPFLGNSWVDPEEGESLIVRKFIQFWYRTSKDWDTAQW